jgi:UDP-3-O-[3-hydroxymyristoyl] glucosamine N-acyltransferase
LFTYFSYTPKPGKVGGCLMATESNMVRVAAKKRKTHWSATIHTTAEVDSTAIAGVFTVIDACVRVGKSVTIAGYNHIHADVLIGDEAVIEVDAHIGKGAQIGAGVRVPRNTQIPAYAVVNSVEDIQEEWRH